MSHRAGGKRPTIKTPEQVRAWKKHLDELAAKVDKENPENVWEKAARQKRQQQEIARLGRAVEMRTCAFCQEQFRLDSNNRNATHCGDICEAAARQAKAKPSSLRRSKSARFERNKPWTPPVAKVTAIGKHVDRGANLSDCVRTIASHGASYEETKEVL
jgi:hypothetical protein